MKQKALYAILIITALMKPALLSATSSRLQDTAQQFSSGGADNNQTQVRGTGSAADVELHFQFQPLSITNPPGSRDQSSLAYEQGINTVLLFGGANPSALSDTWKFSPVSGSWANVNVSTIPSGRFSHGIAALGTGEFLMFGGKDSNSYNGESWLYNGTADTWRQLIGLSTAPCARAFFAVASDTVTHRAVIFGGRDASDALLGDLWVFDAINSTWTLSTAGSGPSARTGASMAYDPSDGLFYLFGGNDAGGKKQDLWQYNPNADTWNTLNPADKPGKRDGAVMFYDVKNTRLGLWGGQSDLSAFDDAAWYYNRINNLWYSGVALSTPVARTRHSGAWMGKYDKVMFFGGFGVGRYNDTTYLSLRSTGAFTSAPIDAYQNGAFTTDFQWTSMKITPPSQPATTILQFQVASSTDNSTWSAFTGPAGLDNYYPVASTFVLWSGHDNRRFLRYRGYVQTTQPPTTPSIDSVETFINFAPYAPQLSEPLSGSTTGSMLPFFTWQNAVDPDNASVFSDSVTYQVQAATSTDFAQTVMNTLNITSTTASSTVFHSTNTLSQGAWYWRARAFDAIAFGPWSTTFTLIVDTVAPVAVTDLSALPGSANGQALLSFSMPFDANPATPTQFMYQVRFATYGPINETVYQSLSTQERNATIAAVAPGSGVTIPINGLADATTYYFALKITDEAGNQSAISTTSPDAFTNAAPVVSVTQPTAGVFWTRNRAIAWISSDPNPGDTRTFAIGASSDTGASFGIFITSGIANGTTFYNWDTRQVCNGSTHLLRITATDWRGLSGTAISPIFTVYNENEAPVVTISSPAASAILVGLTTFFWSVSDPNRADTHTFMVMISSDGGLSFPWSYATVQPSLAIDTRLLPNGINYLLTVTATDSGIPALTGSGQQNFMISNNNLPPRDFRLLSPSNGTTRSPLNLEFRWEQNGDPNAEDVVSYTLIISSKTDFSYYIRLSAGASGAMMIPPDLLTTEVMYYWLVEARDPFGLTTRSLDTFWAVVFSRYRTETPDGRISVQALSGMPDNGLLRVEAVPSAGSSLFADAEKDTIADRHIKYLGDTIYEVSVRTVSSVELPSESVALQLTETYPDANNDGYYDGTRVPVDNLRCARINMSLRKWELLPTPPVIDRTARTLTSIMNGGGTLSLMGALVPQRGVSSLMNYPNPFNANAEVTNVKYVLTENHDVSVKIYTMMGDLVWHQDFLAGTPGARGQDTGYTNELTWDGRNDAGTVVANGMYLMEVSAGSNRQVRKIGVLKK